MISSAPEGTFQTKLERTRSAPLANLFESPENPLALLSASERGRGGMRRRCRPERDSPAPACDARVAALSFSFPLPRTRVDFRTLPRILTLPRQSRPPWRHDRNPEYPTTARPARRQGAAGALMCTLSACNGYRLAEGDR